MKILYLIDSLGGSGAEQSTAAMLPVLRADGHSVSVATLYESGTGDEDRIRADGFAVRPLSATSMLARIREVRGLIRVERPDIVHTALFTCDLIGRLAAIGTSAKVVSSLVNTPYDPARLADPAVSTWKLRGVQVLDSVTTRLFVDAVHAVSIGVADVNATALRISPRDITVVERGRSRAALGEWSEQRRARVRAELGIDASTKVVLAAGRQEFQKAHVDLIAAAGLLAAEVPDLRVLIAGRAGNASAAIEACLRDDPAAARIVTLLGHRHDVPDLLVAADVLAVPSLFEGTAGIAIEAMALRCPVVATDLTGVRGILADERNSILVPINSPRALADALRRVFDDEPLAERLRTEGLDDFERRFHIEASTRNMVAFYAGLAPSDRAGTSVLQVITDTDRRGAQVFATDLDAALAARGLTVRTVALAPGSGGDPLDVPVLGRRAREWSTLRALRQEMASVDVTVAHGSSTLLACGVAGLGGRRPFVYRQISDSRFWAGTRVRRIRVSAYLRRPRSIVALSAGARATLTEHLHADPARIDVIPNGVPSSRFRPATPTDRAAARRAFGLDADATVILSIGALEPEKRVDAVIEVVAALGDTVHLLIAGAGSERRRLSDLAAQRAPERVHFAGTLREPWTAYWAADLVVLAGEGESMPAVLIEAGLSALATITTRSGSTDEVVVDGCTGLVVEPNDPIALRSAVQRLVNDGDLRRRMGNEALGSCRRRYDMDAIAAQWQRVLERTTTVRSWR